MARISQRIRGGKTKEIEGDELHRTKRIVLPQEINRKEESSMTYSIGEVAKMLEVSPVSLRNWERQGLIPKPHRSLTNRRRYGAEDIEAIKNRLTTRNQVK
tara:strand:+ start:152 stop:454 length:303 start_codon:yes stop_codon:yes gene_type:complete